MTSKGIIKKLLEDGWIEIRVRGSHRYFKHPEKSGLVTVPHPKKDLPLGTVKSILRQAQLL